MVPSFPPQRALRLVGIMGAANAGKTLTAGLLEQEGYVGLALSTPLKKTIQELFRMSAAQLNDPNLKNEVDTRYGVTPRYLMQHLGTDVFRKLHEDLWVNLARDTIIEMQKIQPGFFVTGSGHAPMLRVTVTDVRFPNEARMVKELGGELWLVTRPAMRTNLAPEAAVHASETSHQDIPPDFILTNNGDIVDLRKKILGRVAVLENRKVR